MDPDADNPTLLQVLVLERVDRANNMARFYVLSIEPTLFEDLALVRRWVGSGAWGASGSTCTRPGQSRRSSSRNGSIVRGAADTTSGTDSPVSGGTSRKGAAHGGRQLLSPAHMRQSEVLRQDPEGLVDRPVRYRAPFPIIAKRQNSAHSGSSRLTKIRPPKVRTNRPTLCRGLHSCAPESRTGARGQGAAVSMLGISLAAARRPTNVFSQGTQNLIAALKDAGVRRLIVQSSFGVGDSRGDAGLLERVFYALLLRGACTDKVLQEQAVRESGLDYTIVRPTRLTKAAGAGRYTAGRPCAVPLIARADVARFILDAPEPARTSASPSPSGGRTRPAETATQGPARSGSAARRDGRRRPSGGVQPVLRMKCMIMSFIRL